jgi:hypothetical protein
MTKAELEVAVRTGDWMTGATLDEVANAANVLRHSRDPRHILDEDLGRWM